MSYILDALKKAERQRRAGTVPGLATIHAPAPPRRFRAAWFVLAGAILVNAGLAVIVLRQAPSDAPSPTPPPQAPQPAPRSPLEVSGAPPPATPPPPAAARPRDLAPQGGAAPAAPPRESQSPLAVRAVPPQGPDDARPVPPSPAPAGPERRQAPPREGAPPEAPPAVAAPAAVPAARELPAPFREAVVQMRLQALVFADDAADRRAFINGRTYGQGDLIDGKILVVEIVDEGVVLGWEGHRHLLRHLR